MDSSDAGYRVGRTEGVAFVERAFQSEAWLQLPMTEFYRKSNL